MRKSGHIGHNIWWGIHFQVLIQLLCEPENENLFTCAPWTTPLLILALASWFISLPLLFIPILFILYPNYTRQAIKIIRYKSKAALFSVHTEKNHLHCSGEKMKRTGCKYVVKKRKKKTNLFKNVACCSYYPPSYLELFFPWHDNSGYHHHDHPS